MTKIQGDCHSFHRQLQTYQSLTHSTPRKQTHPLQLQNTLTIPKHHPRVKRHQPPQILHSQPPPHPTVRHRKSSSQFIPKSSYTGFVATIFPTSISKYNSNARFPYPITPIPQPNVPKQQGFSDRNKLSDDTIRDRLVILLHIERQGGQCPLNRCTPLFPLPLLLLLTPNRRTNTQRQTTPILPVLLKHSRKEGNEHLSC